MNRLSVFAAACLVGLMPQIVAAQAGARKPAPNPNMVRVLDKEAERLRTEFVDSLVGLADGYETAGDMEKAKSTLSKVLELDPKRDKVKQRLEEMQGRVFDENQVEVEVDVTRSWISTNLKVRAGEPVRLTAKGTYKLLMTADMTPDGVDTSDINRDMVADVKLGQLMGVVFPPPEPRKKPKPGKPFAIGTEKELTPEESGMLFLRLNVPAGTNSKGSVRVGISGNFER